MLDRKNGPKTLVGVYSKFRAPNKFWKVWLESPEGFEVPLA